MYGEFDRKVKEGDVIVLTKVDFAIRNGRSTGDGIGKEVFEGFPSIFTISEVRLDIKIDREAVGQGPVECLDCFG